MDNNSMVLRYAKLTLLKELQKELNQHLGHSCAERKLDEFIERLTSRYSIEDISTVVSSQIASSFWDGRYDKIIKEWADLKPVNPSYPIRTADQPWSASFTLTTHPCHINMFAHKLIEKEREIILNKEYELTEVFNNLTLFIDEKFSVVKFNFLFPKSPIHFYYVRGTDDDPGCFGTVEKLAVYVNYVGVLLSHSPLLDENESYREVGDMDLHFPAEQSSIGNYLEEPEKLKLKAYEKFNER